MEARDSPAEMAPVGQLTLFQPAFLTCEKHMGYLKGEDHAQLRVLLKGCSLNSTTEKI